MKKQDLQIPEPCDASWEQMRGDEKSRFCDHCTKDVHNLSMLTKDEAAALLEQTGRNLCVQYAHNSEGQIMFRDDKEPSWRLFSQKQGLKLLLSAAALAVPMLLGACDEPAQLEPAEATATSPIKLEDGKAASLNLTATPKTAAVGAGRAPTFQAQPSTQPEPYEVLGGEPMPVQDDPQEACDGDKVEVDGQIDYAQERGELEAIEETTPKVEPKQAKPTQHYEVLGGKPKPPSPAERGLKKGKPKAPASYHVIKGDAF